MPTDCRCALLQLSIMALKIKKNNEKWGRQSLSLLRDPMFHLVIDKMHMNNTDK